MQWFSGTFREIFPNEKVLEDSGTVRHVKAIEKAKAEYKPQVASRPNPQAKASQQPRSNSSVMPITAKPSNLSLDEQARYTTAQRLARLGYKVDWRTTSLRDMLDAETRLSTH